MVWKRALIVRLFSLNCRRIAMPRPQRPFNVYRRKDTGTFQFTINPSSGIPAGVCREWQRRSSQDFPPELALYRNPKNRTMAENAAMALINLLSKDANRPVIPSDRVLVGSWLALFTAIETSPRAARNLAKGRPYSIDTIQNYQCYYRVHLKGDPLMDIKLDELDETCILQFINRLSNHHIMQGKRSGAKLAGTDTFGKILKFVRMAFTEYQKSHRRWINPFQTIDPPLVRHGTRGALSEEEVIKLFTPGVLLDEMERAVCAAMFLAGLRRSEMFALRPEDLDWCTPKIMVCRSWQNFDSKTRVLGPPKSKRARQAPFDKVLQGAIKKLWEVNGQHEFVFSF
jgi:site-specific recombinase XerC